MATLVYNNDTVVESVEQMKLHVQLLIANTQDIYKDTKITYETLVHGCRKDTCPTATAGPSIEYILNSDLILSYNIAVSKKQREMQKHKKKQALPNIFVHNTFNIITGNGINNNDNKESCSEESESYLEVLPSSKTFCPAPVYIDAIFAFVKQTIHGWELFSDFIHTNEENLKSFKENLKKTYKRLFRVYAHIYLGHFQEVCALDAEAHLNSLFKRFVFFALSYDLLDSKETLPLDNLIKALRRKEQNRLS